MIVITGATGQLGSLIVAALLERVPAAEVGISVRDPGRAADLAALGVRVRRGDFSEPHPGRRVRGCHAGTHRLGERAWRESGRRARSRDRRCAGRRS
ncbi:MAG: NAD(P)H-binding protein [Streptosporangiaceae bacterium]